MLQEILQEWLKEPTKLLKYLVPASLGSAIALYLALKKLPPELIIEEIIDKSKIFNSVL